MNTRVSRTNNQKKRLSNMNDNQSNWSRCNSFSSSSNDSSVFCSSFNGKKRLAIEESPVLSKRNRNSSGSSASSNLSSFSDKDIKNMPVLVPAESITNNSSVENLTDLPNFSSATLSLQHEALLNNGISHSLSMDTVLPFRHNLRRNIRKKTCSCDCTATCTTVVVSREYKGVGQKTVEKTVISRTKVKTYMERRPPETPINKSPEPSRHPFEKSSPNRNEQSNRKRRSEIEKLYDSLHEIKWAKNFSPDNILRQFDVRQAASCSIFGRSPENKTSVKTGIPTEQKHSCTHDKTIIKSTPKSAKLNSSNSNSLNGSSCTTRSRTRRLSQNDQDQKLNDYTIHKNSFLDKNIVKNSDLLDDSTGFDSYPVLTKEVFSPEDLSSKTSILPSRKFEFSAGFNAIQTSCSSCKSINFPKLLSFDINSESDIESIQNVNSCTFFDIAEEEIRTIDACFREVGAEVVVSTCYESDYQLPRLTSVKEIALEKSVSSDYPPILKPAKFDESLNQKQSCDTEPCNAIELSNEIDFASCSSAKISELNSRTFFPILNLKFIIEEDYTPPQSFINQVKKLCDHSHLKLNASISNEYKSNSNLPFLNSSDEAVSLEQNFSSDSEPPILESCLETIEANNLSLVEHNNFTDVPKKTSNNKTTQKTKLSTNYKQICENVKLRLLTKSLIIRTGRQILNRYLKLLRSKPKILYKPLSISKHMLKNSEFKNCSESRNSEGNFVIKAVEIIPSFLTYAKSQCSSISNYDSSSSLSYQSPVTNTETLIKQEKGVSATQTQSSESIRSSDGATVITIFDQKLSYSESPEKISVNKISNSSISIQRSDHSELTPIRTKRGRKPSTISNTEDLDNFHDLSGYIKILTNSKQKQSHSSTEVKIPPRMFTCHYQAINVTHGSNYIQIVLKITRGKSVFLTQESLIELKEAITRAGKDDDCKLLILNGFGKTFCLGLDVLPIIGERKHQVVGEIANAIKDLISTLSDFNKPLVAIVNGAAFGLGLTLLNHADVALATNNASFCMPYSQLGYMPEGGATLTLPQSVGTTVAMDLILRGQEITAQQAREIGLINEVVELQHLPKDLVRRVQTMAENSPAGMETTKAMMKMRLHIQLPLVLETETQILPQMWLSASCQEAIKKALRSGFLADR